MKKFITIIISLVLFLTVNAIPVCAEKIEVPDLYSEYFDDIKFLNVYTCDVIGNNSVYSVRKKPADCGYITLKTKTEIEFDTGELAEEAGYSENMFSLTSDFYIFDRQQNLAITMYSDNHELNNDIFSAIYTVLDEKYDIISAYDRLDSDVVYTDHTIQWDTFIKTDEYGFEVSTAEYLSKKKIEKLRNEIAENNFSVTVDDAGKIIFDESASETEKFEFAIWFREKYGFCVSDKFKPHIKYYNTTNTFHYTDIPGDVDNDNYIDYTDAEALRWYLLSGEITTYLYEPHKCFNAKNADLTGDGVLDVFDLVLLRQLVYYNQIK